MEIFINLIIDTLLTGCYFIAVAIIVLFLKYVIKLQGEWYRKILHLFFMGSIFPFTYLFDYYWTSLISLAAFLIVALIGLTIIERYPFYTELLDVYKRQLLHYNSFEKPWHYDHVRYGDKFWEESAGSPFYEDLLKIRNSVDENHIKKGKQGAAALLEKALYLAEQDEGTFKKTLAL